MGIGHSGGDVTIWTYVNGELETWTDHRTHQDVYGKDRFDYWRGRYEGFTNTISIVAPSETKFRSAPSWLLDILEAEFGSDMEVHSFNPPPRGKS